MSRVRGALAAAQRHWWLVALLVLLVAAGSLVQYVVGTGAAHRDAYIATRSLRIVLVPEGASTAYSSYVAARQEDEIARTLVSSGLLSSAQLDEAIATRMRADHIENPPTARDIAAALAATHDGSLVILTARGRTPAEADAIATAATETLTATTVGAMVSSRLVPSAGAGLVVQVEGSAGQPTRDTTQSEAALWQVVMRVALALVAGILLALLVGSWVSMRSRAPRLA